MQPNLRCKPRWCRGAIFRQDVGLLNGCTKAELEAARVHMRDLASAWQVNIVESTVTCLRIVVDQTQKLFTGRLHKKYLRKSFELSFIFFFQMNYLKGVAEYFTPVLTSSHFLEVSIDIW